MKLKSKSKLKPKTKPTPTLILAVIFSLLGIIALYLGITWQRTIISPPKPNQTASPVLNKPTPTPIPSPIKRPNTGPLILTTPEGYTLSLPSDLITQYVAKPDGGYALFFTNKAAKKCQQTLNDYQAGIDITEDGCLLDTMFIRFATISNDEFADRALSYPGGWAHQSKNKMWLVVQEAGEGLSVNGKAFVKHNNQILEMKFSSLHLLSLQNTQPDGNYYSLLNDFLKNLLNGFSFPNEN
jgi:hypothetical protein